MSITTHSQSASLLHWRSFGQAEWRHVRAGATGLALGGAAPVILFYATLRLTSFAAAVAVVLIWSTGVFLWHRHRTGQADVFSGATFGFACVQGLIGLLSGDPYLYLASSSLENLLYAAVILLSALAGKPLLALYAQRLYPIPERVRAAAAFRRAFLLTSAFWFTLLCLRAAWRLWLLSLWQGGILPLEAYLIVNTVSGWPFNLSLAGFTMWYPLRELRRAGLLAAAPVLGDVEQAVEEAAPGLA